MDGYLPGDANSAAKGIVFEFQGCYWHGCPAVFQITAIKKKTRFNQTFAQAYESTCEKIIHMRRAGYEVRKMWECDFERLKN